MPKYQIYIFSTTSVLTFVLGLWHLINLVWQTVYIHSCTSSATPTPRPADLPILMIYTQQCDFLPFLTTFTLNKDNDKVKQTLYIPVLTSLKVRLFFPKDPFDDRSIKVG